MDHLFQMTDSIGIFQHASFTEPNLAEGYCTDDNARALILTVILDELEESPKRVWKLATTYAAILELCLRRKSGAFPQFSKFRSPLAG